MHKVSNLTLILLLCVSCFYAGGVHAVTNRKDVLSLLQTINARYDHGAVRVWTNENHPDPSVEVGDTLNYTIESDSPQFYLMVLVDPKGSTSIVFPDLLVSNSPGRYLQFVYPPADTGVLTQGEPVGTETVFAIASDLPVTSQQLGFDGESDIQGLGNDLQTITSFVNTFNMLMAGEPVNIARHQYVVDADVQISSRAFRRELAARVQQVNIMEENNAQKGEDTTSDDVAETTIESEPLAVSDITFENDSDTLTDIGRTQLDVFGSELVNLWESGVLPRITLEGHTDDRGSTVYNQILSERRSVAAKLYLMGEYGLPSENIATRGMGETKPIVSNATATSRSENRRVEIRVAR